MTEQVVVPELGTPFTSNFSVMLRDYIFAQWPYSGLTNEEVGLNKPTTPTGQSNYIEFRAGLKDDFKTLQVLCLQGRTVVVQHMQTGWKRELMTTQVMVSTLVKVIGRDDTSTLLRKLDQAVNDICVMYRQANQVSGDMRGIKDLIYEGSDRIYGPRDQFDKSEWETRHSILMLYEIQHADQ